MPTYQMKVFSLEPPSPGGHGFPILGGEISTQDNCQMGGESADLIGKRPRVV